MGCWHTHHCGPCWGPYPYWTEEELRSPRRWRRREEEEEEEELRDYVRHLEDELSVVRRRLEELAARREPAERSSVS